MSTNSAVSSFPDYRGAREVARRLTITAMGEQGDVDGVGPILNPDLEGSVATSAFDIHTSVSIHHQFHLRRGNPFRNIRTVQAGSTVSVITGCRAVSAKGGTPNPEPNNERAAPIPASEFQPAPVVRDQPLPPAPAQLQPQAIAQVNAAAHLIAVRPQPAPPAQSLGDQIRACLRYVCCCPCFKKC